MDTVYVFLHGTSQDQTSSNETTVRLAKQARADGHQVIEFGGPGSTERSILRTDRGDEIPHVDEIGIPLDYAADVLTGTAVGSGLDDVVEDVIAKIQAINEPLTEIVVVGFSRGAVASATLMERLEKVLAEKGLTIRPRVRLFLLDPVPGPALVARSVHLPAFVDELYLRIAKHEGRSGFGQLDLFLADTTKLDGDMVIGVHGDIGGSTQSPLAEFHYLDLCDRLELKPAKTSFDLLGEGMEMTLKPARYSDTKKIITRTFPGADGQDWNPSERGDIETPSAGIFETICNSFLSVLFDPNPLADDAKFQDFEKGLRAFPRLRAPAEHFAQRRAQRDLTLMVNQRPIRSQVGRIVFPRSAPRKLPRTDAILRLLRRLK